MSGERISLIATQRLMEEKSFPEKDEISIVFFPSKRSSFDVCWPWSRLRHPSEKRCRPLTMGKRKYYPAQRKVCFWADSYFSSASCRTPRQTFIRLSGLVKTLLFRFHQGRDVQQDTADYSVSCELSLRGTHLTGKESSPFHG